MTIAITGLTVTTIAEDPTPGSQYLRLRGAGTYTAADFTVTAEDGLGFTPSQVHVLNLTDRNESWAHADESVDASGLKDVAAGTKTDAAHGVTIGKRAVTIDVSVAGPITDDDTFILEFWA